MRLPAQSDAPIHYYDSAIGLTGPALKSALHSIIAGHTVLPYTAAQTDTWDALKRIDEAPGLSAYVLLIYSQWAVPKSDQYTGTSGTWEREHLWPQSYGITAVSENSRARSDLFNLRPIDRTVNSSRGNKYYDRSTTPVSMHPEAPGSTYDNNSWEPREDEKGTIARSMFYMALRYDGSDPDVPDLELSDTPATVAYRFGKLTTLLAWHRQFAVAQRERERNARIYSDYQHNRNPFIDHSEYAEMVFLGVSHAQAWKRMQFSDAELADEGIGGDSADPDQDGLSNLLEYTFNGDPWQPGQSAAVAARLTSQGGTSALIVSYPHNRNATDVAVTYESTSDFQTWTAVSPLATNAVATSSETEQVTVRFPASASSYLVLIRATRANPANGSVTSRITD